MEFGVFVLWLLINHKLFLKNFQEFPKAGVEDIFQRAGVLHRYKSLTHTSIHQWQRPKYLTLQCPRGAKRVKVAGYRYVLDI